VTTFPKFRFLVGAVFGVSIFLARRPPIARAQTDMFIYPAKGQNQAQQDKDRYECHSWAVQQTGFDPSKPQSANSQSASQRPSSSPLPCYKEQLAEPRSERLAVRLRVTRARALLPGPQWGIVGGFRRRDERMREADRRADAAAVSNPGRPAYMRAMSACLQGRGYTVN
jgi:hypothetical protein